MLSAAFNSCGSQTLVALVLLLLVHSVDQYLLVRAAVAVGGEPGEPEQDDCHYDQGEDDEVAGARIAQNGNPQAARCSILSWSGLSSETSIVTHSNS